MERVVVENNHLSQEQQKSRSEELANCHGDDSCRSEVREKYRREYDAVQERITTCTGADQCVAIAKELRALQSDYSTRIGELQEKARANGIGSLTAAETSEWANLRGALSNIEASRDLVIHRAQMTGGSEETSREIANIMGSTGIASAGGIAGGIGKGGKSTTSSDTSTNANTGKESSQNPSPKTPTGSKGNPLNVPDGTNKPATIEGRQYSAHSLDRMQRQGITSTVVENAINPQNMTKGKIPGTMAYHDQRNNLTVITDEKSGRVVTVDFGIIKQ